MIEIELKQEISKLLSEQMQCVLATLSEKQPCQHLMAYAYTPDLTKIYLATYGDTRKCRNMLSNPSVSLLWDNRIGNDRDHNVCCSLIAAGRAEHLHRTDENEIRAILLHRNPSLDLLLKDSQCEVFVVKVEYFVWTRGYHEIRHYRLD